MSTAGTSSTTHQTLVEQRLDALDRALLGLLPRSERLELVAQVETRLNERLAADPAVVASLAEGTADGPASEAAGGAVRRRGRRSRLALLAGVLGIVALVMLLASPVSFVISTMLGDIGDGVVSAVLLGGHVLVVALGGLLAVVLSLCALGSLKRRATLTGHGWAITGLCTGPLPACVGGLVVLIFGLQVLLANSSSVQYVASSPPPVYPAPVAASFYPTGGAGAYQQAPCGGVCPAPLPATLPPANVMPPVPPSSAPKAEPYHPPGYAAGPLPYPVDAVPAAPFNAAPKVEETSPATVPVSAEVEQKAPPATDPE